MLQRWMIPADLAPGDTKSLDIDWTGFSLVEVTSTDDPEFDVAFGTLWAEFGARGEIEQPEVLARRFEWDPRNLTNGCALRYEMDVIRARGELVAVRDQTAIVLPGITAAIVHMSHNLVLPRWRRSGIAGWLRALPLQTARRCLAAQRMPVDSPVTLVGEMEHPSADEPSRMTRLIAYEKAGYKKIDPARVPYRQPDFRAPEEIDLHGAPRPLPLMLLVRRVGREADEAIPGADVRRIVESLYRMYGAAFRASDMQPLFEQLASEYPAPDETVRLSPPTETSIAPR